MLFGINLLETTWESTNIDSNFPASNLSELNDLGWQARTLSSAESYFSADMGTVRNINLIHLNDVNFSTCYVEASTNGTTWGTWSQGCASVQSGHTNRYNVALDMRTLSFNHQFIRVKIPAQTCVDGTTYYRISSIALTSEVIAPTAAPSIEFQEWADYGEDAISIQKYRSGGKQVACFGSDLIWHKSVEWKALSNSTSIQKINGVAPGDPLVYYEDSSNAYLCTKAQPFILGGLTPSARTVSSVQLDEIV